MVYMSLIRQFIITHLSKTPIMRTCCGVTGDLASHHARDKLPNINISYHEVFCRWIKVLIEVVAISFRLCFQQETPVP